MGEMQIWLTFAACLKQSVDELQFNSLQCWFQERDGEVAVWGKRLQCSQSAPSRADWACWTELPNKQQTVCVYPHP